MLSAITRVNTARYLRLSLFVTHRYIMSVPEFVAAAEQADSSLRGEGKAQAEIQKAAGEVEALAKDVAVSQAHGKGFRRGR
jgi:hypothetical protein